MNGPRRFLIVLVFGICAGVRPLADQQPPAALTPLSEAVLERLPQDWREPAHRIKASEQEQQRFLKLSDVVLRQNIARILIRSESADAFVKTQLTKDPAPASAATITTCKRSSRSAACTSTSLAVAAQGSTK